MGFWSAVGSFVGSAVSAVSSAVSSIGSTVKSIVSTTPMGRMFDIVDVVEGIVDLIKDIFGNKTYDSSTASVEETRDINRELAKYAKTFHEEATKLELRALEVANDYFDQFLDKLEEIKVSNEVVATLPFDTIKKDIRKMRNKIQGSIKKEIDQKYSLDNADLLAILEMDPGQNRDNLLENLSKNIMREALENLASKIEKMSEEQGQLISAVLEEQIDQIAQTVKTENKLLKELENSINAGEKELANKKASINYTINLCDVVVNDLQAIK